MAAVMRLVMTARLDSEGLLGNESIEEDFSELGAI